MNKIIISRFEKANAFYATNLRSRIMSRIKGKNTIQEVLFRKALYCKGVKYRTVNKYFPGNSYIANRKYKLAILVDGEFWHGFDWGKRTEIKTNIEYCILNY